jgi:hypothetical protein
MQTLNRAFNPYKEDRHAVTKASPASGSQRPTCGLRSRPRQDPALAIRTCD